jgi:hypothetical protein
MSMVAVETHWWDIFLFWLSYHDGTLNVRIGAVCLVILVVLLWNAVAVLVRWYQGPQTTA